MLLRRTQGNYRPRVLGLPWQRIYELIPSFVVHLGRPSLGQVGLDNLLLGALLVALLAQGLVMIVVHLLSLAALVPVVVLNLLYLLMQIAILSFHLK